MAFGDMLLQVHPADRVGLEADWNALLRQGRPFERVVRIPANPAATAAPTMPALAAPEMHLRFTARTDPTPRGTLLDVTRDVLLREQADRAQALKAEAERLTEVNRLKTQFINMAAHELNTPLTPITISLATLKRGDAARKPQAETLAILERNVHRLVRLLRDVLDSARLQSDRIKFDLRTIDLAALAREALEEHRLVAEERGLQLRFEAEPTPVHADAARLGEVLGNLLSNAVKFTPAGGEVAVAVGRHEGAAFLQVRDTGRGLDNAELHLLFQPFSQVGPQEASNGTGLGLYIARGIVERLGGRLWAESPGLGKGATFRMELPLAPADKTADAGIPTP